MTIQINEVWNGGTSGSKEIGRVDVAWASLGPQAVYDWIAENRPDLTLCTTINGHGFHAIAI